MPAVEATVMTPPRRRSTIAGRKAWVRVTIASQLTRTISASRSGSSSRKRPRSAEAGVVDQEVDVDAELGDLVGQLRRLGPEVALDHVGRGRELLRELLEAVLAAGDEDQVAAAPRRAAWRIARRCPRTRR